MGREFAALVSHAPQEIDQRFHVRVAGVHGVNIVFLCYRQVVWFVKHLAQLSSDSLMPKSQTLEGDADFALMNSGFNFEFLGAQLLPLNHEPDLRAHIAPFHKKRTGENHTIKIPQTQVWGMCIT